MADTASATQARLLRTVFRVEKSERACPLGRAGVAACLPDKLRDISMSRVGVGEEGWKLGLKTEERAHWS